MTRLADLQAEFHSFLLGGDSGVESLTVGSDRLPAASRLAVYADAYRLRLMEVLSGDFPGLAALVGRDSFQALGNAYIDAHPSDHPSVRWFGRRMTAFLSEHPPYCERSELAEMAAFEWAQGEVMDAADSPSVSAADLGDLPPVSWPGMRIAFQSALRRLDLYWNVPVIWQAVDQDEAPPKETAAAAPVPWLLWRRGIEVHWRSLDPEERCALDAARRGDNFAEVCQELLTATGDEDVPLRAAGYLKRWVEDELVSGIDI